MKSYDEWKLMSPEDENPPPPEIPEEVIENKLSEWMKYPPNWLWEKAEEACLEDYYRRRMQA